MLDEIALIIFISCIIIYISLLTINIRKKTPSQRNTVRLIYAHWVEERLKDDSPIAAVQALRNFIMGNSAFISALFILLGLIVGFYSSDLFNNGGIILLNISISLLQVSVNIFIIIFSLFNFILSLRFVTRLSLLISGNPQKYAMGKIQGIKVTEKTLISAQNHWMIGVRALFFLVPTMLWLISSIFFIIGSVIVTLYMILFQDFWLVTKKWN